MKINQRQINDVTLLDVDGNLVLGQEQQFEQFIAANIEAGGRKLIANLEKVKYMDSTGLGQLILGYKSLRRAGGDLRLVHVQPHLMKLLEMTRLSTVFTIFDSECAALASFTAST